MDKVIVGIIIAILVIAIVGSIGVGIWVNHTPSGRAFWNSWQHDVQKADDNTRYETRKQVEDTCRATIVSYKSDALTYEQYKDSESAEQRGWAEAAKMRANKAAITYNEYFLKNRYVFEDNVPSDILTQLPVLE